MISLSTDLSRLKAGVIALFLALTLVCSGAVRSYASKSDPATVASAMGDSQSTVVITRGMAEIVPLSGPVADIMVADPSLVDVMALQANKLYMVGTNYGTTSVIAVDGQGNVLHRFNVHVKIDESAIQGTVDRLFPNEVVKIAATADQIILTGHVSTPDIAQRVTNLVTHYIGEVQDADGAADEMIVNMLTVSGEQQVMLKVKIVEASRDVLREFGIETEFEEEEGMTNLTGGLFAGAASALTSDPLGIGQVIYNTGANGFGPVQMIIRALEENGLVNTLAEPNLTAISGEQAGFLAGGEFPVPTSRDEEGNIIVTYRPFGVALNFRPVVLSENRISLQLQTEVSAVSEVNSFSQNQLNIPGFSVRRAQTTVELGSGGSLMIAGLLQSDASKTMTQLPGIGSIPILGDLLSSESFQRQESELVIIITAFLVKPYADQTGIAEPAPTLGSNGASSGAPLSQAFADNIQRTYAKLDLDPKLFTADVRYGYLID